MEGTGFLWMIIGIFLIIYSPAIILLIVGLVKLRKDPRVGKILLILAGLYVLIGAGICAVM
jgi:hypothetical protein